MISQELINLQNQNKTLIQPQLEQNRFMKLLEAQDKDQIVDFMFKHRIKKLTTYIKYCEYKGWKYGKVTQQLPEMQGEQNETNLVLIYFKNKLSSKSKKESKLLNKLHQKYLDQELLKQQELQLYQAKYQKDLEEREVFEQLTKSFLKKMKIDQVIQEVKATEDIRQLIKVEEGKDSCETQIECNNIGKKLPNKPPNKTNRQIKPLSQSLIDLGIESFAKFYRDECDTFMKTELIQLK